MTPEIATLFTITSMVIIGSTYAVCVILREIRRHLSRIEAVQWDLLRHFEPDNPRISSRRIGE